SNVKVLDVGCGFGFWKLEMTSEFSLAKFYGIDSKPSFPESVSPKNVEFIEANILQCLPFKDAELDYFVEPELEGHVTSEALFRWTNEGSNETVD
ncbi:5044_t:CDS:2, partial [Funneliformis geosporum]